MSGREEDRRQWTVELLLLTWTAGALDGLSYLSGHVFTANMTGNIVLLGLHSVRGEWEPSMRCLVALAAFAAGSAAGAVFSRADVPESQLRGNLVLAARIEFALVAAFCVLWVLQHGKPSETLGIPNIVLAAVALGIQSVAVRRLQISGVVTTFITGAITSGMAGLVEGIRVRRSTGEWPPEIPDLGVLASMLVTYLAAAAMAVYLADHRSTAAALLPIPSLAPVMFRRRSAGQSEQS